MIVVPEGKENKKGTESLCKEIKTELPKFGERFWISKFMNLASHKQNQLKELFCWDT